MKFANEEVDLIISEWNMPVMDGLEFFQSVKKEELTKDIPFLMVTVEDSKEKVIEAVQIGVKDYIIKPLSKTQFEQKVRTLLKISTSLNVSQTQASPSD